MAVDNILGTTVEYEQVENCGELYIGYGEQHGVGARVSRDFLRKLFSMRMGLRYTQQLPLFATFQSC